MTELRDLITDMRAHAHEAPSHCAALMRRAARELERRAAFVLVDPLTTEKADAGR
jgi:hypothetical protein